jgi:exopolysaccharide biosynthesis polyprenyl glycosylphosphotransferase
MRISDGRERAVADALVERSAMPALTLPNGQPNGPGNGHANRTGNGHGNGTGPAVLDPPWAPHPQRQPADRVVGAPDTAAERVAEAGEEAADLAKPTRWQRRYLLGLVVSDFVFAALGATFALFTRFGGDGTYLPYVGLTAAFPFIFVAFAAAGHAYDRRYLGAGAEEFRRLFDNGVKLAATAAVVSFAFKLDLARGYLLVLFLAAGALTLLGRYGARRAVQELRVHGHCQDRVVVVGKERSIAELVRQVRQHPTAGFQVIGACLDHTASESIEDVPVLGDTDQIVEMLHRERADALAVTAWSDLSQADLRRICWQLEGSNIQVLVAPRLTDIAGPRIHIRPVAGLPLLHVEQPVFSGGRRFMKNVVERVVAGVALLAISPILCVVGAAIRLTSKGPAFFRQTRVGATGRPFTMFKFRTMVVNADQKLAELRSQQLHQDSLLFKMARDPRVTPIGRWLRRLSLDELPQLINVVNGTMSLVGPRPPLPDEVSCYPSDVRRRLLVRPGITGLWQISGRSDLAWSESVRLDLYYVENWSIGLDLSILCRTLFAVISGRGAY